MLAFKVNHFTFMTSTDPLDIFHDPLGVYAPQAKSLCFICFHFFPPTERPSINAIQEKLVALSMTPTWTNVAYQKYYGPSLKY